MIKLGDRRVNLDTLYDIWIEGTGKNIEKQTK